MGFSQGLSGLNTSSRALDVISNNIANTSTVGFKSAHAVFADIYAGAQTGVSSGIQVGYGSKITAVWQSFIDGTPTTTSNPLDMAIVGNGFYVIERFDGSTAYTRNGQFDINKDGYIITALGEKVMGIKADANGNIPPSGGIIEPLFVSQEDAVPKATIDVDIRSGNLNADAYYPGSPPPNQTNTPFDPADLNSYELMHTIPVYDSLGGQHSMEIYFVKDSPMNWSAYVQLDGDTTTQQGPTPLSFDAYGKPTVTPVQITYSTTVTSSGAVMGDPGTNNITIDLTNLNQFGAKSAVTDHGQDGYTVGRIAGIVVSQDGTIQGRYTNGQAKNLGQVVLATFRSNQGLASVGDNMWIESPESGPPIVGRPRSGLNGLISGGQVEESNVDLTQELVNMIIQQRNYQANAQTIRTQDQIMQTLVNLR